MTHARFLSAGSRSAALRAASILALGLMLAPATIAQEKGLSGAPKPAEPPRAMQMDAAETKTAVESLSLRVNKTYMLEFDTDIDDIIVANPAIANVTARDRRRVAVMGMAPGDSNIIFLDKAGRKLKVVDVSVTDGVAGVQDLHALINRYIPSNKIQIESVNGKIILAGSVPNLASADRAVQLANQFVKTGKDENNVLNLMTIEGKDQVTLKVRIVEMQRNMVKQLGINLSGNIGFGELTGTTFQNVLNASTSNSFNVAGSALGGLLGSVSDTNYTGPNNATQSSVALGIAALERVGLLRTLAEPNLTSISGEPAKFLAGGEFPVPVAQDQGKIGIEFKPFGVGLGFTPVVLSEGRISLQVSTEVSELSPQGSFTATAQVGVDPTTGQPIVGSTLTIPALKVRRAETTVELPSGGSLVIAGLIQETTKQSLDGVPGAKDLPVLGALFRSRDFENGETELVVIVTPYLVEPTDPQNFRSPDQGYVAARDARTVFFGKLNEVYAVPGSNVDKVEPPKGASGFIID